MNTKLACLVALGSLLSGPALATTYTAYHYGDVTGLSVSDTIYESVVGSFEDDHFFSLSSAATGYGIISNIRLSPLIDIDSLTVYLWQDLGTVGVYDGSDVPVAYLGTGHVIQKTDTYPSAGNYFFKITGSAQGTGFNLDPSDAGAEYGAYFFNASTVPVPEAETWAMMAMGLGLVGLQLRRKNKKSITALA